MLKAKKKLSKKELKEDQFVLFMMNVRTFIYDNARQIGIGLAVLVALVLLAFMAMNSSRSSEDTAATVLAQAQQQLGSGDVEGGLHQMGDIVNDFAGTDAAEKACFFLIESYLADGKIAEARTYIKIYMDSYAGSNFMTQAVYAGHADCLMQDKNAAEAASFYEKAARTAPHFPRADAYRYSAAVAFSEAGNNERARSLAQAVVDGYNKTHKDFQLKEKAEVLLAGIK